MKLVAGLRELAMATPDAYGDVIPSSGVFRRNLPKLKNADVIRNPEVISGIYLTNRKRNHVITVSSVIILGSLTGFIKKLCDQLDAKLKQAENMAKAA
jgi:hypothetical protein